MVIGAQMTQLPDVKQEYQRLLALRRFDILDTPPDGSFDRITRLAAELFEVPIALVSLVDEDRIWFKSRSGLDNVSEISRDPGLCASAILSDDVYLVEDARSDPRTLANPLVAGEFGLQFYAAAPLVTADGYQLGTLCVIDHHPRHLPEERDARPEVRRQRRQEHRQRPRAQNGDRDAERQGWDQQARHWLVGWHGLRYGDRHPHPPRTVGGLNPRASYFIVSQRSSGQEESTAPPCPRARFVRSSPSRSMAISTAFRRRLSGRDSCANRALSRLLAPICG